VGTFQACVSPVTYGSLTDGSYTFSTRGIDAAGNVDASAATRSYTITAPVSSFPPAAPTISSPSSYSWSNQASVTVSGNAAPGSTVEIFDGASLGTTKASALGTWSKTLTGLDNGAHLFSAKASNLSGTSASSSLVVFQVDTLAPNAPVIVSPVAGATVGTAFALVGTAESGTTLELFQDGVSIGTVAASTGVWTRELSGVKPGSHTYTARATDMARNVSALAVARTVTVTG
jgi:hypothetical protein